MYVGGFGSFGTGDLSWWSGYSAEKQQAVVATIQSIRAALGMPRATGYATDILRAHTRSLEEGGGFVIPHRDGSPCLCVANTDQDVSRQIDASGRCPLGTGGVPGTNVGGDRASVTQTQLRPTATVPVAVSVPVSSGRRFEIDTGKGDEGKESNVLPALPGMTQPGVDEDIVDDGEGDGNEGEDEEWFKEPPPPEPEPTPWYKRPWVWVGGGLLAAGAVAGGVYLARRKR